MFATCFETVLGVGLALFLLSVLFGLLYLLFLVAMANMRLYRLGLSPPVEVKPKDKPA